MWIQWSLQVPFVEASDLCQVPRMSVPCFPLCKISVQYWAGSPLAVLPEVLCGLINRWLASALKIKRHFRNDQHCLALIWSEWKGYFISLKQFKEDGRENVPLLSVMLATVFWCTTQVVLLYSEEINGTSLGLPEPHYCRVTNTLKCNWHLAAVCLQCAN